MTAIRQRADSGTTTPVTTPDASPVAADASVPVDAAAPTDASSTTTSTDSGDAGAPTSTAASAPAIPNPLRPRIALEGGFTWMDLSNGPVLDHFGGYGRIEAGIEHRFDDTFFAQAGGVGSFGWLNRALGAGVNSSIDYQSILAHGRLGAQFFNGNLRFTGGIELGATHVGAPECNDGMSCGALFSRNAQLLPIDSWTFSFGADVGISTLQGALGIFLRYNNLPGVNPAFNVVDGDPLNFGLNISAVQLGIGVDLVAAYNLIFGGGSTARPAESDTSAETSSSTTSTGAGSVESSTSSASAAPTGLELIQARSEAATAARARITTARNDLEAVRGLFSGIIGTTTEDIRSRRIYATEAINQAAIAADNYNQITQAVTEAQAAAANLSGEDRATARGLIREMTELQSSARAEASRVVRAANDIVHAFNQIPNHGEDLTESTEDPIPGFTRRTRRRRRRSATDAPATGSTPATTTPEVVPPRPSTPEPSTPTVDESPILILPGLGSPSTGTGRPRGGADAGVPVTGGLDDNG